MRRGKENISNFGKEGLKILLINPFGIGDVLFSTPLIGIIKERYPSSSISYICNKRARAAIEECPCLEKVYVFEKGDYKDLWNTDKKRFFREFYGFVNAIRARRFDVAIDMSMGHQYGFFLKLIRVPERVGFDYKGRARFHTRRLSFDGFNDKPIGEYYKDLLAAAGLGTGDKPVKIWWTRQDGDYARKFLEEKGLRKEDVIVGIAPGGGVSFGKEKISFKRWPAAGFAELCGKVTREASARVVLIWGPGEEGLVKEIAESAGGGAVIAPATTVRQMAALMSLCGCVVTNDAGPLHVAVASGARTVSVFGPSDQNVYGPYPKNGRHITVAKDIGCRPCYVRFRTPECRTIDCLSGLEAEEVFRAVSEQIKRLKEDVQGQR